MKKSLDIVLLITFVLTLLVPITGVHVHKLVSLLFLILCLVHTVLHWRKMNGSRWAVLVMILTCFLTGVFGMVFEEYPWILALHKVISIAVVAFLAIHIFKYGRLYAKYQTKRN